MTLKFISLFSGIGGLDLGLERAGMTCVAQVEIDPFCRTILARHWPDVPKYEDVREYHPDRAVDAVAGGFPCQDISVAGKRAGLAGQRSGLFWEAMRIVDESRPRFVLLENVAGLLSSNGGRDFGTVLEALADRGFAVEWSVVSACAVGAPHVRRRLFILAYASGEHGQEWLANTDSPQAGAATPTLRTDGNGEHAWNRPGIWLASARGGGRMAYGIAGRMVKAAGNAVVPQVAEVIGERLMRSPMA